VPPPSSTTPHPNQPPPTRWILEKQN
jgi:hypothetical protein